MARDPTPGPPPEPDVTEQSNPRTHRLSELPPRAVIERILAEDAGVPGAVSRALDAMTRASDALADALEAGGRWINVGAGTSGRIGALDAAEIPPTFGLAPDRVVGVIAGGDAALRHAVEGAEDDRAAARDELRRLSLGARDALVAISASGSTPFVLSAAAYASSLGAATVAITCTPGSALARQVDVPIVVVVGPEAVTGSTRLKGGLAQKMVLHALSTSVMVRLGRVRGNLMTSLAPVNAKLRRRAVGIVVRLTGCTPAEAAAALEASGGSVEAAVTGLRG